MTELLYPEPVFLRNGGSRSEPGYQELGLAGQSEDSPSQAVLPGANRSLRSELLDLGTIDILGLIILCCQELSHALLNV